MWSERNARLPDLEDDDGIAADVQLRNSKSENGAPSHFERFISSPVFKFILLIGLCFVIGIVLPVVWSSVWKPSTDYNIESDLRFECVPLRSTKELRNTSCPQSCVWDNFTSATEIACYYPLEADDEIRSELFGTMHFGKIPRYALEPNEDGDVIDESWNDERDDRDQKLTDSSSIDFSDPTRTEPFEEPVRYLAVANQAPFLADPDNRDLTEGPVVVKRLSVHVRHYHRRHLSVLIKPADEDPNRWSRHFDFDYRFKPDPNASAPHQSDARVHLTTEHEIRRDAFRLQVMRRSSNLPLFDMGAHTPFIFTQGYIELNTILVNDLVFGLGQSSGADFGHNFSFPKSWTLLNQYNENVNESTRSMWGSHPFYVGIDDPQIGDAYGVLLLNSHPIHVHTNAKPSINFRMHGGHLELHFFLGPRPKDVIRQFTQFVHLPALPPYWSLGFHVCSTTCAIPSPSHVDRLEAAFVPVESDCGTALRRHHLVTGSDESSRPFRSLTNRLHASKRKFFSIETPHRFAQSNNGQNSVWSAGDHVLRREIRRTAPTTYHGYYPRCDAGNTRIATSVVSYPDVFAGPSVAAKYAADSELFADFADGFFLDYNTPFDGKNLNGSVACADWLRKLSWNSINFGAMTQLNPCMDLLLSRSYHDNGDHRPSANMTSLEELAPYFALHNLYGLRHSKMIFDIAQKSRPTERPLIMSLATFLGSGRFGGHIGAPLDSDWYNLRLSLKQTLDFSLFGIPLTGFPVGGFRGEMPKDELLRRWWQLASVQPFMIAYTDFGAEPRMLAPESLKSLRSNVQARYKLLPYMYTLLYNASRYGSMVVQPVWAAFPAQIETYRLKRQFMLGDSLLATPALEPERSMLRAYFPAGRWYEYYSGQLASKKDGGYLEISAVEQNINLHLRGGHTIGTHLRSALTIAETRRANGFEVIAAFDERDHAYGTLFIDDGHSTPVEHWLDVRIEVNHRNISVRVEKPAGSHFCERNTELINTKIESFKLYGVIDRPLRSAISISSGAEEFAADRAKEIREPAVKYQMNLGVLAIDAQIDLCAQTRYFLNWTYPEY